jgi:2-phosphosulfolactate phosphatase
MTAPTVWIDTALPQGPVDAVVVIDVIRSTTTALTAMALGRRCLPVPTLEAAYAAARALQRPLIAGERHGARPRGFELDNSPAAIAARSDVERPLVLLSSSGTPLLDRVRRAGAVYAACLRNASAVAAHLVRHHRRVAVLGAATHGEFREEDRLCCARVAAALAEAGFGVADAATAELIACWSRAPTDALLASRSARWLVDSGRRDDLEFVRRHVEDLDLVARLEAGELICRREDARAYSIQ